MRYRRADTSPKAHCPTCGEFLLFLRWGHEERCDAFVERRQLKAVRIGLTLLVLSTALIFFPWRAL